MKTEPGWYMDLIYRMDRNGRRVHVGEWQSQPGHDHPMSITYELMNEAITLDVPTPGVDMLERTQAYYNPNLPWAEDHFQERVGGEPLNPPPSEAWWPFHQNGNKEHKEGEIFSHTYPERIWPKLAVTDPKFPNMGIRYDYGDLADVVNMLLRNPHTRQAYLPIWFPEDTGSVQGQRVPCTLGYQFIIRDNLATIVYFMRSCDIMRHLKDDAYMAARLLQWVVGILQGNGITVRASSLHMHMTSLHCFEGDGPMIRKLIEDYQEEEEYGAGV